MDTACNSDPKYRVWCSVERRVNGGWLEGGKGTGVEREGERGRRIVIIIIIIIAIIIIIIIIIIIVIISSIPFLPSISLISWARQNPNRQVWFLLTSGKLAGKRDLTSTLLHDYTNLQMVTADLHDLFKDTPLLSLFNSRKWTPANSK